MYPSFSHNHRSHDLGDGVSGGVEWNSVVNQEEIKGDLEESSMVDDVNGEAPKVALKRGILEKLHHYQTLDAMFQLMVIRYLLPTESPLGVYDFDVEGQMVVRWRETRSPLVYKLHLT
ncbi:unnamed protein product [Lactuca saligna]|uniref:Uncharacterized protein n=1 Tax=Lactuca saligna TaxID=75948 RepID=A0AA36A073_LACSI|nr:unnamed protein product [Lactuca saligna]